MEKLNQTPSLWVDNSSSAAVSEIGLTEVHDGWEPGLDGEVINDRGDRQVLRIVHPGSGAVYYLKRWRLSPTSLFRCLPGAMGLRKRAASEFQNLLDLQSVGITVPKPVAFGETRGMWGPTESILLLANLDGYVSCLEWGEEHPEEHPRIARGIARIMATLHNEGIYHRSPGLKHFYLQPRTDSDRFAVLDVPRLDRRASRFGNRIKRWLGCETPTVERDLSKVLLGLSEGLSNQSHVEACFWDSYCAERGIQETDMDLRARVSDGLRARRYSRERRRQRKSCFSEE